MTASNRATRRRTEKSTAKGEQPLVDVTLADVQQVLAENPLFRQAVVNVALQRQLAEARVKLAVYETVAEGPAPEPLAGLPESAASGEVG